MKRVVVTGATGFLGKILVRELKKESGLDLRVFDRDKHSFFSPPSLDDLVEGSNLVYHLAGINDPQNSEIFNVNVIGTRNLLESIRNSSPQSRIVFSSSFAVYKLPSRGDRIDEKYPTIPRNYYGFTKLLAEEVIGFYHRTYKIKSVILRFSNIYGKGMPANKHSVISNLDFAIKNDTAFTVNGRGIQTRDFLYLDDAIKALIKAKEMHSDYGIYNVCSGEEINVNELVSLFEKKLNKKALVKYDLSKGDRGFWKGNYSLFQKQCGWKPKTLIREGVARL